MPKACSDRSQKNSRCRREAEAWATWDVGICGVVETERRRMKLPLSLVRSENGIRERTLDALGRTQNRQPFGLAHGSSMLSPHSDAGYARSDQSLSPAASCTHTPCGRVTASSLRLSHPAAALWSQDRIEDRCGGAGAKKEGREEVIIQPRGFPFL